METRKLMRECRKIWKEVLSSEDGLKPEWALREYENGCPACEDAVNSDGINCSSCKLLGLWGVRVYKWSTPCCDSRKSPYRLYEKTFFYKNMASKQAVAQRKKCAKLIIDYIEKNYKL